MLCDKVSDKKLITDYINGKEDALRILIDRHQERLFSFIYSKVHDRQLAEDIFQDVFFKVIISLKKGKYNEEGKFLPWVMRIARNLVVDHFRKSNRMPETDGGNAFDIFDIIPRKDPNVLDNMVEDAIMENLHKLVNNLPRDQKEVVVLRIYCELSFKEIAEETGVSINTALGRMRYALMNLRKQIEEHQLDMKKY